MDADDLPVTMKVSSVQELLACAKNCYTAPSSLTIDLRLRTVVIDQAIKAVGCALRDNTHVQHLRVYLDHRAPPIEEESMKGILHFLASNPSLTHLDIFTGGNGEAEGNVRGINNAVREAAASNVNIPEVIIHDTQDIQEYIDPGDNPETMHVYLLHELLACAKNCDTAPASLSIDFDQYDDIDEAAINAVGYALRDNNRVQHFEIYFSEAPHRFSLEGVFHFVACNPSLKYLIIKYFGTHGKAAPYLLKAAKDNANIRKLSYESHRDTSPPLELCELLKRNGNLLELRLSGEACYEGVGQALSENTVLDTLCLEDIGDSGHSEIFDNLRNSRTSKIKNLDVSGPIWCSALSTYLLSPHTAIQKLSFCNLNFRQTDHDCADNFFKIDQLLLALMGSRTTTSLACRYCEFDAPGIEKFVRAIRKKRLAIQHLDFCSCSMRMLRAKQVRRFLDAGVLETLGLHHGDRYVHRYALPNIEWNKIDLTKAPLSTLKMSTLSLEVLVPALRPNMTLRSLEVRLLRTASDEDVSLLANMICNHNNQYPQLQELTLHLNKRFPEGRLSKVVKALELSTNIRIFQVNEEYQHGFCTCSGICKMMEKSLEKISSLRVLKLSCDDELKGLDELVCGVSKNKSLENVSIVGNVPPYPHYSLTVGQLSKLEFFTERNKLEKMLSAKSPQHKSKWVEKLSTFPSFWEGFTLTFLLLQQQPALFFS